MKKPAMHHSCYHRACCLSVCPNPALIQVLVKLGKVKHQAVFRKLSVIKATESGLFKIIALI